MAGFEVIVRPVVFPNIRPQPTRSLPPEGDPEQGQAVLSGGSGQVIALTHSYSGSASTSGGTETERTSDKTRVYQKEDDGTVNRDNFVDLEVVTQIKVEDDDGDVDIYNFKPIEESDNVEILEKDVVSLNPNWGAPGHTVPPVLRRTTRPPIVRRKK